MSKLQSFLVWVQASPTRLGVSLLLGLAFALAVLVGGQQIKEGLERPSPRVVVYQESHWYGKRTRTMVVNMTDTQAARLHPLYLTEEQAARLRKK